MHLKTLSITTGAGTCPAKLFLPDGPAAASVLFFMDAFGPRPALDAMAGRLVGEGYAVLLPDLLYRCEDRSAFDARTTFSDPERGPLLKSMLAATPQAVTIEDCAYFLLALDSEGLTGPVGVTGYCMGGARALNAAAHHSGRIVAAASWHGGNLAGDIPDSPHLHAGSIRARVHVGVAGDDGSFPPAQSALFAQVFREAGVDYTLENYPACRHGWCVPDHTVYDEEGAERHWKRLLTLFEETLKT